MESTIAALVTCDAPGGTEYCPTGTITHINQTKGKTVVETFDGSSTAKIDVSKPKGDSTASWALSCTPR